MKRKIFSLMLMVTFALAGTSGCARKADSSFGLLGVAKLMLRFDFDRYVIRPGEAVTLASNVLKKLGS